MPWPSARPAARRCASARNAADRAERALLERPARARTAEIRQGPVPDRPGRRAYAANGAAKAHKCPPQREAVSRGPHALGAADEMVHGHHFERRTPRACSGAAGELPDAIAAETYP